MNLKHVESYRATLDGSIVIVFSSPEDVLAYREQLESIGATTFTTSVFVVREDKHTVDEVVTAFDVKTDGVRIVTLIYVEGGELRSRFVGTQLSNKNEGVFPE